MAAKASADNGMLFCVQEIVCQGYMRQQGRFAELGAGAGILIEARSPSERTSQTEARLLTLRFCRELLPLRTAEITEACARTADPAAPAMQMLSGYLGRLFEVADELTGPQRLDAGRAAIELLAMVLRDVAPSVPGGDGPEGVLLDMMRTHVREHLADPELRVEELARRRSAMRIACSHGSGPPPVRTFGSSGCSRHRRCCPTRDTPSSDCRTSRLPSGSSRSGRSSGRSGGSTG